jgi:hypothetical protein
MIIENYVKSVILEYTDAVIRKLKEKYRKTQSDLTEDQIEYYIQQFDLHKNDNVISKSVKGSDIFKYSFLELESIIDSNYSKKSLSSGEAKKIFDENGIQIFLGNKRENCILAKKQIENKTEKSYTWCISRDDTSNMFTNYRKNHTNGTFYLVNNDNVGRSNLYHAYVILAYNNDDDVLYKLTSAQNSGDVPSSWSEIEKKCPELTGLRSLFIPIPYTKNEKLFWGKLSDKEFSILTYDEKEDYIDAGHEMTHPQLLSAFKTDKSFINKYANLHRNVSIPIEMFSMLPESTKKLIIDKQSDPIAGAMLYDPQRKEFGSYTCSRKDVLVKEGFIFTGTLKIDCPDMTDLPARLTVNNLEINRSSITSLPSDITITGDLIIADSPVINLNVTRVLGNLMLSNVPLTNLPDDLIVGGDLRVTMSLARTISFGKNTKVHGRVMPPPLEKKYNDSVLAQKNNVQNKIIESVLRKLLEAPIVDVEDSRLIYSHPLKGIKKSDNRVGAFNKDPEDQIERYGSQEYKNNVLGKLKKFNSNIYFAPMVNYENYNKDGSEKYTKAIPFEKFEGFVKKSKEIDEFDKETLLEIFSSYKKKANVKNDALLISFGDINKIDVIFSLPSTLPSISGAIFNLRRLLDTNIAKKLTGMRLDDHIERLFNFTVNDTQDDWWEETHARQYFNINKCIKDINEASHAGNFNIDHTYMDSIRDVISKSGRLTDDKEKIFNQIKISLKRIENNAVKDRQKFDNFFRGNVVIVMM